MPWRTEQLLLGFLPWRCQAVCLCLIRAKNGSQGGSKSWLLEGMGLWSPSRHWNACGEALPTSHWSFLREALLPPPPGRINNVSNFQLHLETAMFPPSTVFFKFCRCSGPISCHPLTLSWLDKEGPVLQGPGAKTSGGRPRLSRGPAVQGASSMSTLPAWEVEGGEVREGSLENLQK